MSTVEKPDQVRPKAPRTVHESANIALLLYATVGAEWSIFGQFSRSCAHLNLRWLADSASRSRDRRTRARRARLQGRAATVVSSPAKPAFRSTSPRLRAARRSARARSNKGAAP